MTPDDVYQLMLVAAAAVLAPLLVATVRRFAIPSVVLEIVFGIILGPQVLDLVQPTGLVDGLSVLSFDLSARRGLRRNVRRRAMSTR